MDGFKNTTKTSYDTTSGRKFANGGMTVSRADMPGGEGPMNKPALVAKYANGGPVKKALGGAFNEKGKRATLAETEAEDRRMGSSMPAKKAKPVGPSSVAVSKVLAGMAKKAARNVDPRGAVMDGDMMRYGDRALVRKAARMADPRGAVMEGEKDRYGKGGKVMAKKGVPAHSDRPMVRRAMGGLSVMPKGGKC
jgi:hypothetical protein